MGELGGAIIVATAAFEEAMTEKLRELIAKVSHTCQLNDRISYIGSIPLSTNSLDYCARCQLEATLAARSNAGQLSQDAPLKEGDEVWVRGEVNVLAEGNEDWIEIAFNDTATGAGFVSFHPDDIRTAAPSGTETSANPHPEKEVPKPMDNAAGNVPPSFKQQPGAAHPADETREVPKAEEQHRKLAVEIEAGYFQNWGGLKGCEFIAGVLATFERTVDSKARLRALEEAAKICDAFDMASTAGAAKAIRARAQQ